MTADEKEQQFAGRAVCGGRKNQQDYYAFAEISEGQEHGLVVVVADGMGGYAGGEIASRIAVHSFIESIQKSWDPVPVRFDKGLRAANDAIRLEIQKTPQLAGMGTTLLAVSILPSGLEWISVGDTALYVLQKS